jgi:hypothetical protein
MFTRATDGRFDARQRIVARARSSCEPTVNINVRCDATSHGVAKGEQE